MRGGRPPWGVGLTGRPSARPGALQDRAFGVQPGQAPLPIGAQAYRHVTVTVIVTAEDSPLAVAVAVTW